MINFKLPNFIIRIFKNYRKYKAIKCMKVSLKNINNDKYWINFVL
jgi:hypothetical protein